jgi:hypothetical protein
VERGVLILSLKERGRGLATMLSHKAGRDKARERRLPQIEE